MAAALSLNASSRWSLGQNAEINVTPFVDVMLVLLIIFMVALPTATVSVKVDLPKAQASPDRTLPPVVVSLTLDGRLFVGDHLTLMPQLVAAASAALGAHATNQRLYLRADKGVRYGDLMAVMNTLHAAGFEKVALMSEEQ